MVDLPEPFSPTRQCTSPAMTSQSTASRARTPPKCLVARFKRRKGADESNFLGLVLFFERAGRADRTLAAESQDALEVRNGAHLIERRLVAVVHAFCDAEAICGELHVGIIRLLIGDRVVGPFVV